MRWKSRTEKINEANAKLGDSPVSLDGTDASSYYPVNFTEKAMGSTETHSSYAILI